MELIVDEVTISSDVLEVRGSCSSLILELPHEAVNLRAGFKVTRYHFDLDQVNVSIVVTTKHA